MKKNFTFLILLFITTMAIGQPVINSNLYPLAGFNASTALPAPPTSFNPGPAGANQTWNFSGTSTDNHSYTYVQPSTTPFVSHFPASNLTEVFLPGNFPGYTYYNHSSSMTEDLGFAVALPQETYILPNSDPKIILTYPFTFNSQFSDSFFSSGMVISGGDTIDRYQYGTRSVEADAYGTLTTPAGTFNNTLRLKIRETIVDSIPLSSFVSTLVGTTYRWISDLPGHVRLFEVEFDTVSDNQGNSFEMITVQYQTNFTVDINDLETKELINVYPNPANNLLHISGMGNGLNKTSIKIIDLQGRFIKEFYFDGIGDNRTIDISTLENGLYFINIISEVNQLLKTTKFNKIE